MTPPAVRTLSSREKRLCVDLFSGKGGFSQAFRESPRWTVVEIELDESHNPDVAADVLDLRPSDFPDDVDVVLASPPCTAFSMAASGTHLDADGRPVSEWGAESLTLTHHTVGLIEGIDPDWYFIENPMGGMRRLLGDPDRHIWWCQYGADRAKPTDLWGRIPPSFDERACSNGNDDCHHEPAPRGSDAGTQSGDLDASERAKLPHGLSRAILESVENPEPQQASLYDYETDETVATDGGNQQ